MWNFLARNKQVAAMMGLLTVAALVVIFLTTKGGGGHIDVEHLEVETEDVSGDAHIFSTHR